VANAPAPRMETDTIDLRRIAAFKQARHQREGTPDTGEIAVPAPRWEWQWDWRRFPGEGPAEWLMRAAWLAGGQTPLWLAWQSAKILLAVVVLFLRATQIARLARLMRFVWLMRFTRFMRFIWQPPLRLMTMPFRAIGARFRQEFWIGALLIVVIVLACMAMVRMEILK